MSDGALALPSSARFREYIRTFRARHPLDAELAAKYGFLTEIEDSDSMNHATRGTFTFGGTA